MNEIYLYCLLFIAGASIGSFFYTLYVRFISTEKFSSIKQILVKPSACPFCTERIPALYLIPVFGYFFSLGMCRKCGLRISPFYPAFELLSGIALVLAYNFYNGNVLFIFIFLISLASVTISLIDFKIKIIPDFIILMIFVFSIYPVIDNGNIISNLYGLLFMMLAFGLILLIFPGSFGGGDFKYAVILGFLLGLELSILVFEISVISGAAIGTGYGLISKRGLRIKIPFGPFLTAALLVSLFFGNRILLIYYNLFK